MSELYSSAEEAAEAAREHLRPQYAPFGMEPKVYIVEACGLRAVCVPWGHSKMSLAAKQVDLDTTAGRLKFAELRFNDTLFWIEGQRDPGKVGALKHARVLADLGDKYSALIYSIVGAAIEQESAPEAK